MQLALTNSLLKPSTVPGGAGGDGPAGPAVPVVSVAPAVTGTPTVFQTLSCSTGTWSNTPLSYAYQWKRAGVDIPSATSNTYALVQADFGLAITCRVTATNGAGAGAPAISNATSAVAWPATQALGAILTKDFATDNLTGLTIQTGTGTIALGSGKVDLSGGNGGFTNYIYLTSGNYQLNCLEKWRQEITFRTPNPVVTDSYGFSAGVVSTHSTSTFRVSTAAWMKLSGDGGTLGRFSRFCINNGAPTQDFNGGSNGLLANNTVYTLVVTRDKNTISFDLYVGVGTGGSLARTSFTSTFNITSSNNNSIAHNTGRFALWNHGGTLEIHKWIIDSTANRMVDVLGVGDSNMYGMYVATPSARYVEQAAVTRGFSCEILAGAADTTAEALSRVNEIIAMNPRIVYLNTLSNDIAITQAYSTPYQSLVTAIKAAGIKVVHGTPIARNGVDIASGRTFLQATYPSDIIADIYEASRSGTSMIAGHNSGDNIHANATGNTVYAGVLATALNGL